MCVSSGQYNTDAPSTCTRLVAEESGRFTVAFALSTLEFPKS